MEKRGIQELEHKIKELEKESEKQENYIKELEHKDNYIKELEQKIKELENWQRPHRSFTDLDTGLSEMVDATPDLDTGLSEMVDATSMEISVEEELLASGIPEFNSFEHFIQWLDCENCLM
jgi:predicted RNase H-like nuclease (RuvC/YqgF family)